MIVITTPTGDIGHRVLHHVLHGSEPVRVIARDPSRIPQEIRERVEFIQGSHGDAATIEKALTGADALFWLIPPEPLMALNSVDQAYVSFTKPAAEAIRGSAASSASWPSPPWGAAGQNGRLATANIKADDLLASTGVALRVLAMPSFMDNLLRQAQTLKEKGMFSSPIHADLKAPTVATSDIAAVAAKFLMDTTWTGQAEVPVLGPRGHLSERHGRNPLGCSGQARSLSAAPIEAYKSVMTGHGMSEAFVHRLADMMMAKNEGIDHSASRAVAADTRTTFRQWCEAVLKPAVLGSSCSTWSRCVRWPADFAHSRHNGTSLAEFNFRLVSGMATSSGGPVLVVCFERRPL